MYKDPEWRGGGGGKVTIILRNEKKPEWLELVVFPKERLERLAENMDRI